MSVSIFTPCHSSKYLLEAYESISNQPYNQWVLFPNHGLVPEDIPEIIRRDPRTKIVTNDSISQNIGAIKQFVCSQCDEAVLVELDYDDLLVNNAIVRVKEAFKDPNVVFAYSNCAEFNEADKSFRFYGNATAETNYDSINGWVYEDFVYNGCVYKSAVAADPSPFHTSIIYFAPNHFRAFRKRAYDEIGGHDPQLSVCDDQDLMCRLFQKGKFKHINECCYLYRVHGDNSWLQRNRDIQITTLALQKKYIRPMAEYWAKMNNYTMIDLCGGFNPPPDYLSIDLREAHIISDLNGRWPFENSSVGVIRANDAIEHLSNIIHTMSEIHRVLIPGGYLLSDTPSTDGRGSFMDPTHQTHINQNSFWYYTRQSSAQYIRNTHIRFKEIVLETHFPNAWCLENNISYVRADLMALKDGFRPMGPIGI